MKKTTINTKRSTGNVSCKAKLGFFSLQRAKITSTSTLFLSVKTTSRSENQSKYSKYIITYDTIEGMFLYTIMLLYYCFL